MSAPANLTRRSVCAAAAGAVGALAVASGRAAAQDVATNGPNADAAAQAERLFAVDYTEAERAQMLGALEGQLDSVRALRAMATPNDLAPAQVFDPRLPGVAYPTGEGAAAGAVARPDAASATDDDLAFGSIALLGAAMASGRTTSRALTELYLARIAALNSQLHAFITLTADRARAEADRADAERASGRVRGPLHGIPYALKDLFDAAGVPSTWGASLYADRPPAEADATIVRKLSEAGAVLLGKASCGALAYGDIWFGGVTRNPWSPAEGSSGSSAGSASAVAAGLCAFAIGTETLGSIVSPSHRCGTTGLRPTFGRVSRSGGMALCWSLDKVGPITRFVGDAAQVLAAIAGPDAADPSCLPTDFNGRLDPRPLRDLVVGFDPRAYEDAHPLDLAARDALSGVGVRLVERALPDIPAGPLVLALYVEAAAAFEEITLTNADDLLTWQDDRAWPNTFRAARFISAIDYVQVDRVRRRLMGEMHAAFGGLDAVIGPNFARGMLTGTNFTGHPQLALRAGFIETPPRTIFGAVEDPAAAPVRVPYATSLWAPLFREDTLLTLGAALEAALGVAEERPPMAG